MSRRPPVLLVAVAFLLAAAPATAQSGPEVVLRLEAHEGPLACDPAALELLCFKATEGDPTDAFVAGETVRIELTAMPLEGAGGGAPHNLVVGLAGDQGDLAGIDSGTENALAVSDTAQSGELVTLQFTVPATGTLYFWCDVETHEPLGMNFTAAVQPAPEVEVPVNNTTGDGDDPIDTGNGTSSGNADDDAGAGGDATATGTDGDDNGTEGEAPDAPAVKESPALPMLLVPALALGLVAARRRRSG